ncbi:MAG: TlpA disulfide reductase family protein [Syntrophobacter sp.]
MVRRLFICVVASVFITSVLIMPLPAVGAQESVAVSGKTAPDFEVQDLSGSAVALSKFKGKKPVMLYFWATWCPYCMSVRPAVIKLRDGISKDDLEFLAINVGGGDSLAKLKRFDESHPSPLTVLYDAEGRVARLFNVQGIPHFVLIDKKGIIRYSNNELPSDPMQILKQ